MRPQPRVPEPLGAGEGRDCVCRPDWATGPAEVGGQPLLLFRAIPFVAVAGRQWVPVGGLPGTGLPAPGLQPPASLLWTALAPPTRQPLPLRPTFSTGPCCLVFVEFRWFPKAPAHLCPAAPSPSLGSTSPATPLTPGKLRGSVHSS